MSPALGGNKSSADGAIGADCSTGTGPIRSRTDEPAEFFAAITVIAIEVQIKAIASIHVTLVRADAAARPVRSVRRRGGKGGGRGGR